MRTILLSGLIPLKTGGIRSGDLSLRQQRMSLPMLEALRLEDARVHMSLVSYDDSLSADRPTPEAEGKFCPRANEFLYLRMKVTNISCRSPVFCSMSMTEIFIQRSP